MTSPPAMVLTLLADPRLADSVERSAAAAGPQVVRAGEPSRTAWVSAAAVVVDRESALGCIAASLPRREGVFLVDCQEPSAEVWSAAVEVGAQHVCVLPGQENHLVRLLADAVDLGRRPSRRGSLIAVTGGRGGAGASVFAAALAQSAGDAFLVDLDPCSGGLDLLMGGESAPGLRWPDLGLRAGRLDWPSVRDALPRRGGIVMLSSSRAHCDITADAVMAVVEAGRRGGMPVICDVPRQLAPASRPVVEAADLVVVVATCDVRGIAATAAVAAAVRAMNRNLGLVVRGPAPGGLSANEAVAVAGIPLLAAMRPEPMLDRLLEDGGLRMRRRSPLMTASRRVLDVLESRGGVRAA